MPSNYVYAEHGTGFYEQLKFFANYGPAFQRLQTLYKGDEEFIIEVRGAANDLREYVYMRCAILSIQSLILSL